MQSISTEQAIYSSFLVLKVCLAQKNGKLLFDGEMFLLGFLSNLPFSTTKTQYLKVRQVAFIDFLMILSTKKKILRA